MAAVKRTQEKAEAQQKAVLSLQTRVAEQDGRAIHTLNAIERAREAFLRRLFVRDGLPIWSAELWSESAQNLVAQSHRSFSRQVQALGGYFERKGSRLVLQGVLFLAIFSAWSGRAEDCASWAETRRATPRGCLIPRSRRRWCSPCWRAVGFTRKRRGCSWPLSGAAAMIPTILVVRKLIDRRLFPVLNALVVFYFVDQLRHGRRFAGRLVRGCCWWRRCWAALCLSVWLLGLGRFGAAPDGQPLLEGHWQSLRGGVGLVCGGFYRRRAGLREPEQTPRPRPAAKRLHGPDLIRRGADYRWTLLERAECSTPGAAGFGEAASGLAAQPGCGAWWHGRPFCSGRPMCWRRCHCARRCSRTSARC